MTHFHNSIELAHGALANAEEQAMKQDLIVMNFYMTYPNTEFTPRDVFNSLRDTGTIGPSVEITSIRRAITNLTRRGIEIGGLKYFLRKTEHKIMGEKGQPNFTWVYRKETLF